MKVKIILLAYICLFSISLLAGNEVGNGGVGFWCSKTQKYLLLDFYEYETINPGLKISQTSDNYLKILKDKLYILSKLDQKTATYYTLQLERNFAQINFLKDTILNRTNDSFEISRPEGCEEKQFALQKKNESDHLTQFYFDKKIWDNLDEITKAGLVLHEIIYDQFSYLGEKNSIKVRKFNSYIFSSDFEKTSIRDYQLFIKNLKVPLY